MSIGPRTGPDRGRQAMTTVGDVLGAVDILAPFRLAEPWDHVGLLLGDAGWRVRRILVSLGVSEAVVAEAERVRAEALLVHHPLLFSPVDRLTGETPAGRLAVRLLGAGRALIAAHTNLDGAKGGLCDLLAQEAGLQDIEPLHPAPEGKRYKVVVFLPKADLEAVRAAA
ncbi:MAG TPA: Nif3-like dinuclear metal center hexameric protein, partial [Phycisphaerae bacterium]|nr:Nif3-like dinuclear metal center hexameric protein [Phycisphaerae bacterium]